MNNTGSLYSKVVWWNLSCSNGKQSCMDNCCCWLQTSCFEFYAFFQGCLYWELWTQEDMQVDLMDHAKVNDAGSTKWISVEHVRCTISRKHYWVFKQYRSVKSFVIFLDEAQLSIYLGYYWRIVIVESQYRKQCHPLTCDCKFGFIHNIVEQ